MSTNEIEFAVISKVDEITQKFLEKYEHAWNTASFLFNESQMILPKK